MPDQTSMQNINSSYFDGYYKDIWRQIFPEKTTQAETDFIMEEGTLLPGSCVLDMMCGHGRHTLALARKGIHITAVDNLPDYTEEIKSKAAAENLPVDTVCTDVLQMQLQRTYDAVICMGNSLQFFEEENIRRLLAITAAHLKSGGRLFINTWSLAEIVIKQFKEKSWSRFDDLLLLVESKYLFHPARIETNSIIITGNGEREEKQAVDYIYSINEMNTLLTNAGFLLKDIYSIPGKKVFALGDPRAYLVAVKK
jgi:cyclopropane fatty-acyl-phospholipid synthase-like methyltransferase